MAHGSWVDVMYFMCKKWMNLYDIYMILKIVYIELNRKDIPK